MEWVVFTIGLVLMFVFGLSYYAYRQAFHYSRRKRKRRKSSDEAWVWEFRDTLKHWMDDLARVPFEEIYITASDGKKLFGRYYHVSDGAPLYIEFHGYKGRALRDFCGGDTFARRLGCNTLLIDQRAHGNSGGHTITFGVKERLDCLAWVRYAAERFGDGTKIFLSGVSMGAATVLMASELSLPENVVGIIADSPYSSPKEIIQKVCGDMKLPARFLYFFVWFGALLFGHFRIRGGAEEAVRHSTVPILLLHGEGDAFVPCDMSRKICDACVSDVTYVTFAGADHCLCYAAEPKKYEEAIVSFSDKCLGKQSA